MPPWQTLVRMTATVPHGGPMHKTTPAAEPNEPACARLHERLDSIERLFGEKFDARDRALTVAMAAMERRLDGMNEFRDALRDQASRFLPREEYMAAHEGIVRSMEITRIELSKYAVRVDETDKTSAVERAQLDKRLDAMNEFRQQLKDQAATLISRSEAETLIRALAGDVRRLEIAAGEKAGRDDSLAAFERIDTRMKFVEAKLATWDGRLWALGTVFLLINIFVSWWLSGIRLPH
jgi:hypothetical protein